VWDAIALHTTPSISQFKEIEVAFCARGVFTDFVGPEGTGGQLTWNEWDAINKQFPRLNFTDGVTEIVCNFCRQKPETTYDNFAGDVGEAHLEGFSREGNKFVCPYLLLRLRTHAFQIPRYTQNDKFFGPEISLAVLARLPSALLDRLPATSFLGQARSDVQQGSRLRRLCRACG